MKLRSFLPHPKKYWPLIGIFFNTVQSLLKGLSLCNENPYTTGTVIRKLQLKNSETIQKFWKGFENSEVLGNVHKSSKKVLKSSKKAQKSSENLQKTSESFRKSSENLQKALKKSSEMIGNFE